MNGEALWAWPQTGLWVVTMVALQPNGSEPGQLHPRSLPTWYLILVVLSSPRAFLFIIVSLDDQSLLAVILLGALTLHEKSRLSRRASGSTLALPLTFLLKGRHAAVVILARRG